MLAVIRSLENWRYLLEGAKFQFEDWLQKSGIFHESAKVELEINNMCLLEWLDKVCGMCRVLQFSGKPKFYQLYILII